MRDARMRRGTKRRLLAGGLIAAFAFVLLGAALMAYERSSRKREEIGDSGNWNQEQEETAEEELQLTLNDRVYAYSDQVESYLLIGTDNSSADPEAEQGFDGDLADFLVLFVADSDTGKYGFIQIDRDKITDVTILD